MNASEKKYLIIGSGLAGISVATHLIRKGGNVTLIDNGVNHSSIVAAGLITPLVFRRMNKGWRVDDFVPYLKEFYSSMEKETNTSFFHPLQIRRMFSGEQERAYWLEKQEFEEYRNYMHKVTHEDDAYDKAINNFGSGRLKNGAYVNTSVFLSAMKNWISQNGTLLNAEFEYSALNGNTYNGETYDHIIFCEGYMGVHNPWFNYLPLQQTKGETLTIRSEGIPEDEAVNRKCFILPLGNQTFKVGSTYNWDDPTTHTTEEGKAAILEKASYLTDAPIEVVDQGAGIRPTTPDRRPFLGTHPEISSYHVFNGLGTKGYLIAPALAREFADYLTENKPLNEEADIRRFIKKFEKTTSK